MTNIIVTCEQLIRNRILQGNPDQLLPNPLAVHELGILSFAQTAQSARLREMAREPQPQVLAHGRKGKRYNTYTLTPLGREMAEKELHLFAEVAKL
jgi:hypothetical protein